MKSLKHHVLWWTGGILLLTIAVLPLAKTAWFAMPLFQSSVALFWVKAALATLPVLAATAAFWSYAGSRREKLVLIVLCLVAAGFCEHVHHQFVDKGHYFGGAADNTVWQKQMQQQVLAMDPGAIPHSYRFLSHGFVAVFEWMTSSFDFARAIYRLLFNTLLFVAIVRYARVYVTAPSAAGVALLVVMVYPATIALYAGQFVDPASHLSFVACLYFFARGYEPGIGPTVLLGVLAKESLIALTITRSFYGTQRFRAVMLAAFYFALGVAALVAVRYLLNKGTFEFGRISGVGMDHAWANLRNKEWPIPYLLTLGILLPGTVLGWRLMDLKFRLTCLTLTVALVVSSAIFSWLHEVRNLMPALVMLAVVNVKYVESRFLPGAGERIR